MRIAHFGTFDVANYGDLLFPLIAERRLRALGAEIVHVSPAGGAPVWADCRPSISVAEATDPKQRFTGVLLGGGQLVHAAPSFLPEYFTDGIAALEAYPTLWLGSAFLATRDELPLAWNAPGVPVALPPVAAEYLRWASRAAGYLSVRDQASRERLLETGAERPVEVVIDSASEAATLWERAEIEAAYGDAFAARGRSVPDRSIAVHFRSWYSELSLAEVATLIDALATRQQATAILLAIGPCHGDGDGVREIGRRMKTVPLLVDQPRSLVEIAACIARSEGYIGSSLHGAITACSFGKRALLVAPESVGKFGGFLERLDLAKWKAGSWREAAERAGEFFAASPEPWRNVIPIVREQLNRHWARITALFQTGGGERAASLARMHELEELQTRYSRRSMLYQGIVAESLGPILQARARAPKDKLKQRQMAAQRDEYAARLKAQEQSFSWKITKPLRALGRAFQMPK